MQTSKRYRRIEAVAQDHIDKGVLSGIEWLVLRAGQTFARGQAGMADALSGTAMAERPIFRIYSMTKPIVSVAALMLMEQGKLRLMDPVATWLPEFSQMSVLGDGGKTRPAKVPMIIEHLLTHRAGLSYGFLRGCPAGQLYCRTDINDASVPLAGMVETLASLPLAFEPGSGWALQRVHRCAGAGAGDHRGRAVCPIFCAVLFSNRSA